MSLVEFSVLYLSIGSAVGAHRLLYQADSASIRFPAALSAAAFWPVVLLLGLLRRHLFFRLRLLFEEIKKSHSTAPLNDLPQIELERALPHNFVGDDLYRFRDTLQRYEGLTLADDSDQTVSNHDLFGFDKSAKTEIQSICLDRRNRNRLRRHRINARSEFVEAVINCLRNSDQPQKAGAAAIEFARHLNDTEAVALLVDYMERLPQTRRKNTVPKMEHVTWKPQEQQPTQSGL